MRFLQTGVRSLSPILEKKRVHMYRPTVGEDLEIVKQDHLVKTHPANNHNRRTLVLTKDNTASWGFTIQSYGIQHRTDSDIEDLTYVDYVEIDGPAFRAGMKKGDIILSVNGTSTETMNHERLISTVKAFNTSMRLVVLFEDCVRKIELHLRYIKLNKILAAKEFELNSIDKKIERLQRGEKVANPRKLSVAASTSCSTLFDDRWGLIPKSASPSTPAPSSEFVRHSCDIESSTSTKRRDSNLSRCSSVPHLSNGLTAVPIEDIDRDSQRDSQRDSHGQTQWNSLENSQLSVSTSNLHVPPSDLCVENYNSLPVRGKKKRPNSLLLPSFPKILGLPSHRHRSSGTSTPNESSSPTTPASDPSPSPAQEQASLVRSLSKRLRSRSSSRSRSFRASSRQSMSPALCESHLGSSNHVLTESNCLGAADPRLLRLRSENLDLQHADWVGVEEKRQVSVARSFSSPQFHDTLKQKTEDGISVENVKVEEGTVTVILGQCVKLKSDEMKRSQSASGYMSMERQPITGRHSQNKPLPKLAYTAQDCEVPKTSPKRQLCTMNTNNTFGDDCPRETTNQACQQPSRDTVGKSPNSPIHVDSTCNSVHPQTNLASVPTQRATSCHLVSGGCDLAVTLRTPSRLSTASTESSVSTTSSGFYELTDDPFTPSPDDPVEFPYTKRPSETPMVSSLKKVTRRVLMYTRHKDIVRQEMRLMNINEEDEVTRL